MRPRANGSSSTPKGATGRDCSYGAPPKLTAVHVVGDGRASTFKGIPEFSTLYDLAIVHNLAAICLHFGATTHMSGPAGMYGKQLHTPAARSSGAHDRQRRARRVRRSVERFRVVRHDPFCCKYTKKPAWKVAGAPEP